VDSGTASEIGFAFCEGQDRLRIPG
jgi:nucleoside 2-deoxyribosyltransferase